MCVLSAAVVVWLSVSLTNALRQNAAFNNSRFERSIETLPVWPARSQPRNFGAFRSAQRQYLGRVGEDVALVYNGTAW